MKFSSPTHTQNAQFPTIFSVLGRYFFHRSTPHNHTVQRRGDLSFTQPLEAPPARRTPKEPNTPRDAEPNRGAHGRRQGLAGLVQATQVPPVWRAPEGLEGTGGLRDRPLRAAGSRVAISRAAGPDGARNTSGATQRQHAAPTASGRAAAHRHTQRPGPTKQPGPTAGPDGARNTSGATSTAENQAISGSRAPSGSPTRRQHPSARAGAPNRRLPAHGPRPRR